ncbi:MAG: hypothetical protein QNI97_17910 [Desulfobacterales bacterium]|nr:hypothetical protein [Desulfobacterales bacterium]
MSDTQNHDPFSDERISDAEWANRRLCPDGNCIGVIGPDGRCKECGRPTDDALPAAPIDEGDALEAPAAEAVADDSPSAGDDDEWANRRLCPDGNCIGVIGPDGRCKECGRPEEAS